MTFFYDLNKRLNALSEPKSTQLNEGKGDGNLANNAKPYDKVTRGDVIAGRLGKDEMGGKHKDAKSKFKKTNEADVEEGNRFTGNLMKARAAGKKEADLDGDGDMEPVREDVDGEFTAADWKKVVALKRKLMQADPSREPEDAEQEAVEILGYDYDKVLAWLDSDENLEEADYSAKKARAGKDIGKPGKNFEKIAKSAGERYGSKAAGERVAGAVLNKLRGKNESVEEAVKEIPGGRRHTAEPGGYGRKDDDEAPKPTVKKGRGRPKKGSDSETGEVMKPDFSAFGVTGKDIKLPKHTGAVTKHKMVGEGEDSDVEAAIQLLKKAGYTVNKDKKELDEKAVSKAQRAAAGIAYAAKKGDLPRSELRGASKEMAKMSSGELKKFAKTKEKGLPEKKKEVDETTVAGSVAPAAAAPKKAKGGMEFGKGIYEGQLAESLEQKLHAILNEGMSVNLSIDPTGKKSLTVTANDEDADRLGELLKLAGMESSDTGGCDECGGHDGMHEAACSHREQVEEELANSADNTQYADTDTLVNKLSGGLNGPKKQVNPNNMGDNPLAMPALGKTAHSLNLGKVAEDIKEETENRLWNLFKKY